ncbi:MAP kinase-activated protein kinase 5-like [Babylonia areolata]|uniref:MAP kinase-activated protein kinase 5-like n=1 Tax=Babylonia areolata TaxID=304850 RepID=UPI003FD0F278
MESQEESCEIPDMKVNLIEQDFVVHWNEQLGTGVNGPVRPCQERSTGKPFALKCLMDCPRSRQETRIQQLVSGHPHIVCLYRVYHNSLRLDGDATPRPRLFLVMELMEGGELFDRIRQEECFTEEMAAMYMRQAVQGVLCLHEKNIAHRDLKPENFLLTDHTQKATLKISDFGFAKEDNGKLMTPRFTPYFVAPQVLKAYQNYEKVREDGTISSPCTYDKSCDMWSLGVILYIMLCGQPPFYSENPSHSMTPIMCRKILSGDYEFTGEEWEHISQEAKDVICRLLYVDPTQRMTIQELAAHPWLSGPCGTRSSTPLSSPVVLANKDQWAEVKHAHAREMTQLRLADKTVTLKSITLSDNPMIRKRRRRNTQSLEEQRTDSTPTPQFKKAAVQSQSQSAGSSDGFVLSSQDASVEVAMNQAQV